MRCEVLVLNRGRGKHFKRGKYDGSLVTVGKQNYKIPENSKTIELEKFIGSKPLFICDELTHEVLTWKFDTEKNKEGSIIISANDDPQQVFKLNVLVKDSFWKSLAKKLELSFMSMLIYMGAGYGLFRFAEYVVRILFLQEG